MITSTSLELAAFVACREALVTVAYQDGPHMSIGFGSNDPSLSPGDTITIEQAFSRLQTDIKTREPTVAKAIKANLNQNQFDAVFDLYYQNGSAGLNAVASVINSMDPSFLLATFPPLNKRSLLDPISTEFQKHAIDVASGATSVNPGLLSRRNLEIDLFWTGSYGDLSSILIFNGNPKIVKPTKMAFDYNSFNG